MHSQSSGANRPQPVTLSTLRDTHRPLLVFTPNTNPQFLKQIRELAASANDLHQRDVLVVPLLLHDDDKPWGVAFNLEDIGSMTAAEQAATRKRFHIAPNAFTVILIGKDGGEKLRSSIPLSVDTLRSTIDAMPMRQDEMRQPKP
jgi:hypothetical protein